MLLRLGGTGGRAGGVTRVAARRGVRKGRVSTHRVRLSQLGGTPSLFLLPQARGIGWEMSKLFPDSDEKPRSRLL